MSGSLRTAKGKLNTSYLNDLNRSYKDAADAYDKAFKKNKPDAIRRLTDKYKEAVKKKPDRKDSLKSIYDKEKSKRAAEERKAKTKRDNVRQTIFALNSKGLGVIATNSNNLRFYDLTIPARVKTMAKEMSITSDSNIDKSKLEKRVKLLDTASRNFKRNVKEKIFKEIGGKIRRNRVAGGVEVNYIFPYVDADEEFNILDTMFINIKRAINNSRYRHPKAVYNVRLSTKSEGEAVRKVKGKKKDLVYADENALFLPSYSMWSLEQIEDWIDYKFEIWEEEYDEGEIDDRTDFQSVVVSYLIPPNEIIGSGGHLNMTRAEGKWLILDTNARTNCFYRCIAFHRIVRMWEADETIPLQNIKDIIMEEEHTALKHLITEKSKQIKKNMKEKTLKTTTGEDIQNWVNKMNKRKDTRCCVKIFDNVFTLVKSFKPEGGFGGGDYITYELWNANNHFTPLIKWKTLTRTEEIFKSRAVEVNNEDPIPEDALLDESEVINKKFSRNILDEEHYKNWVAEKYGIEESTMKASLRSKRKGLYKYLHQHKPEYIQHSKTRINTALGAYDLETTGNGNDNYFKTYRLSFAWNTNEGIRVKSFGGRDCVKEWFEFLYEKRDTFDKFTFYAHNGGKFDLLLLLNEYIVHSKQLWEIDTTSTICLNGAYINLTINSKDGNCEITFRDSLRLLPMGLGKLTTEFKVPHKKQGEDLEVDFNLINMDNCFGENAKPTKLKEIIKSSYKLSKEVVLTMKPNREEEIAEVSKKGKLGVIVDEGRMPVEIVKGIKLDRDIESVSYKECEREPDKYKWEGKENGWNGEKNGKVYDPSILSSLDFKIELSQRVYCDYDTIGLLECLNLMNNDVNANMNLDLTKQLTGASLSKNNFFKNYYNKNKAPIYFLDKKYDAFCREAYSGGRNEAHYIGEWNKKCYYYDFTSLYPDVARRRVPYGKPQMFYGSDVDKWNNRYKNKIPLRRFVGIMRFKVKTKDFNALPIYGIKKDHKLLFPHFKEWTEISVWSNEFNYANELDIYDHILLEGISFSMEGWNDYHKNEKDGNRETYWKGKGILANFFTDAVERKATAKAEKKLALAQCWKIVANSGYGFWGLNANGDDGYGRDGMEITDKNDLNFWNMVKEGVVSNVGNNGEYMFVRTTKPMPQTDYNVAIAAAITGEARIKIHKFMNAVRKVGGSLLYCDTDSCICDVKLCEHPSMMEEFCWDGTGEELGSMKNEAEEKLEKYFKKVIEKDKLKKKENRKFSCVSEEECKNQLKQLLVKQKELDGGEYSFDKGIIAGCKQYVLHKKVFDGGFIEASASKGCKKDLTYEDFHHLLYGSKMEEQREYEKEIKEQKKGLGIEWEAPEGFRLYEKQEQFRSGLIEHLRECDKAVPVKIVHLNKAMRIKYRKGLVEGKKDSDGVATKGFVSPLIL